VRPKTALMRSLPMHRYFNRLSENSEWSCLDGAACSTQTANTCTVSMDSSKNVTVTLCNAASNQLSAPTLMPYRVFRFANIANGAFSWSQVAHNAGHRILRFGPSAPPLPTDPGTISCNPACLINLTSVRNINSYSSAANTLAPGRHTTGRFIAPRWTAMSYGRCGRMLENFFTSQSPG